MGAERENPPKLTLRAFSWTLAGALLLLLAVECLHPYYFLQDDGLEFILPLSWHNYRSLAGGEWPGYNFHSFTGIPHASLGQAAPLYLIPYLGVILSVVAWGHPFAAIDIMAIIHALLAVAGTFLLLRQLKLDRAASAFGALCALSGFFMWCGQVWTCATYLAAWFPFMVLSALRFLEAPTPARGATLVAARLGLLYAGYPQFFVLGVLFEHLFAIAHSSLTRPPNWIRRVFWHLALTIPTGLLGLPFVVPFARELGRSIERANPLSYADYSTNTMSPAAWLWGQWLAVVQLDLPRDLLTSGLPYASYVGYVPVVLSVVALLRWRRDSESRAVLVSAVVCVTLALLWAMNLLGPGLYLVPIFNRFRWPFKAVYFSGVFQCMLAAMAFAAMRRRMQWTALAIFAVNWIWVFGILPTHAWHIRDYQPPLRSPWVDRLREGRYVIFGTMAEMSPPPEHLLGYNYSTLWGLENLAGYEVLLPRLQGEVVFGAGAQRPDTHMSGLPGPVDQLTLSRLRRLGVRYVFLTPSHAGSADVLSDVGYRRVAQIRGWQLWEDPLVLPRVRWVRSAMTEQLFQGIEWKQGVNSIDISLSRWPSRRMVVAYTAHPDLVTCVDGRCGPVEASPEGLISIRVPEGARKICVRYQNDAFRASLICAAIALAALLTAAFRHGWTRRVPWA